MNGNGGKRSAADGMGAGVRLSRSSLPSPQSSFFPSQQLQEPERQIPPSSQLSRSSLAQPSLAHDFLMLMLKIALIVVAVLTLFSFVFGLYRVGDDYMSPSIKGGDLIMYYRLDHEHPASEVVVFEYNGRMTAARVIAVGGDTVNIDDRGLIVNGSHQIEVGITEETTQVADGVTFPLEVPQGSVFLLGDNRTEAVDSRIIGCVPVEDLYGSVMGQFRRRGF